MINSGCFKTGHKPYNKDIRTKILNIEKYCLFCNKKLIQKKNENNRDFRSRKFCGNSCHAKKQNFGYNRKGIKLSKDHKIKISESQSREKSKLWRGGRSFIKYSLNWTNTLKRSIRERDCYTCRLCGKQQENISYPVHHIDYNKQNCNPDNLITLCKPCHSKTNFNREYWIEYFNNLNNILIC